MIEQIEDSHCHKSVAYKDYTINRESLLPGTVPSHTLVSALYETRINIKLERS